ncbi:hypothetical protein BaRGS_00036421 [Batillaria attramentaria]|uniref:Uncharacterized protein n=1 Tax=Batillaria attramentaria TaxID=370345 RepID=A0ABD0JBR2_9CAEN
MGVSVAFTVSVATDQLTAVTRQLAGRFALCGTCGTQHNILVSPFVSHDSVTRNPTTPELNAPQSSPPKAYSHREGRGGGRQRRRQDHQSTVVTGDRLAG